MSRVHTWQSCSTVTGATSLSKTAMNLFFHAEQLCLWTVGRNVFQQWSKIFFALCPEHDRPSGEEDRSVVNIAAHRVFAQ